MDPGDVRTQEEWKAVADKLGREANEIEEAIKDIEYAVVLMEEADPEQAEYERRRLKYHRKRVETFRLAAGAVLWVAEHAAARCRFVMVDAYLQDDE